MLPIKYYERLKSKNLQITRKNHKKIVQKKNQNLLNGKKGDKTGGLGQKGRGENLGI
jgi:hypothetical protein